MLDFGQLPEKLSVFRADVLSQEGVDFVESPWETPVETSRGCPCCVFPGGGETPRPPCQRASETEAALPLQCIWVGQNWAPCKLSFHVPNGWLWKLVKFFISPFLPSSHKNKEGKQMQLLNPLGTCLNDSVVRFSYWKHLWEKEPCF